MGNRRVGRKRLYQLEKAGQNIDLESGVGIAPAIKSATQHRNGQEIITEIAIDLAGIVSAPTSVGVDATAFQANQYVVHVSDIDSVPDLLFFLMSGPLICTQELF